MFTCGRCYGTGVEDEKPCSVCNGWGYLPGIYKTCPQCQGRGKDSRGHACNICYGKGWITGTTNFVAPRIVRVSLATVLGALLSALGKAPQPVSELATGIAVGLLLAFHRQREEEDLPEGSQLRQLFSEGGWLLIGPDGIWHGKEGAKPTRVVPFPEQSAKS